MAMTAPEVIHTSFLARRVSHGIQLKVRIKLITIALPPTLPSFWRCDQLFFFRNTVLLFARLTHSRLTDPSLCFVTHFFHDFGRSRF